MIPIDVLPDDVLLDIFDFYVMKEDFNNHTKKEVEAWQTLVHVCRRWRSLVFGSPHRLNLQLYCTAETLSKNMDIWPALPLIIYGMPYSSVDNIVVALGHRDRACVVHLVWITQRQLEQILALMQVPFPKLTNLWLSSSYDDTPPVIPDSFLG